jgi:hypothetical protein
MIQEILAIFTVAIALAYTIWSLSRALKTKNKETGLGCSSCSSNNCNVTNLKKSKLMHNKK